VSESKVKPVEKRAQRVTSEEMWQIRALEAQGGRLQAEMQLKQERLENISKETQLLLLQLREKYGVFTSIEPDGRIVFPEKQESDSAEDDKEK